MTRPRLTPPPSWLTTWTKARTAMLRAIETNPDAFDVERFKRINLRIVAARARRAAYLQALARYRQHVCDLWEAGWTQKAIAADVDRHVVTVRAILLRYFRTELIATAWGVEQRLTRERRRA